MGVPVKRVVPPKPTPTSPAEEAAMGVEAPHPRWVIFETTASSPVKEVLVDELSEGYSSCDERAIFDTTTASPVKEVLVGELSDEYSSCDKRAIFETIASSPINDGLEDELSEGYSSCNESFLSESLEATVSSPVSVDSPDELSSGCPEHVGFEEEAEAPSENSSDEEDAQYTLMLCPALGAATPYRPGYCTACNWDASPNLCYRCMARLRIGIHQEACKHPLGSGRFCYCLQCQTLVEGNHVHLDDCIQLGTYNGSPVAWVTKKEKWSVIFSGIQSDRYWNPVSGRPFLLQKPLGTRCKRCLDIVGDDTLYATLVQFCTVECWLHSRGAAAEYDWVNQMVGANFDRWPQPPFDAFCVSCCLPFSCAEGGEHKHDNKDQHIRIITDIYGQSVKVEIARDHFMARPWTCVQDHSGDQFMCSANHIFRLRDEGAMRCRSCRVRLEDGGGNQCSLDCSLSAPVAPRPLKLKALRNSIVTTRATYVNGDGHIVTTTSPYEQATFASKTDWRVSSCESHLCQF